MLSALRSLPQHLTWARCSYLAAGEVRRLEAEEAEAVAQEDFEAAANLSSELDALRWRLYCDRPIDQILCFFRTAEAQT